MNEGLVDRRAAIVASPDTGDLADALERVLQSRDLQASDRQRRLLVYLVEETLAGRTERLKAYNIATAVLGRDEHFDPQTDPIVRIEISHLRRCLERYYLTEGSAEEFRIVIPKGVYVPHLVPRASAADAAPSLAQSPAPTRRPWRWRRHAAVAGGGILMLALAAFTTLRLSTVNDGTGAAGSRAGTHAQLLPSLLVERFANDSDDPQLDRLAGALTLDVTAALAPFKSLAVYLPNTQGSPAVDYRLQGFVAAVNDDIRVTVQLLDVPTNQLLWARSYSVTPASPEGARRDIPRRVAQSLGNPYGAIFTREAQHTKVGSEIRGCIVAFYRYVATDNIDQFQALRDCHEKAAERLPDDARIWTDLALLDIDEYRFGLPPKKSAGPPLDRALKAAERAIELDQTDARGHLALALASWFRHDLTSFDAEAAKALALNPDDPIVLCEIGLRRVLRGDIEHGATLVRRALAQGSGEPVRYHFVLALYAYLHGDYPAALDEAARSEIAHLPLARFVLPAIYGKLGRREDATTAWDAFARGQPQIAAHPRATLLDREWSPDIVDALIAGLRAAGIPIEQPASSNVVTQ